MCGYIATNLNRSIVQSYLQATHYRGPDASMLKEIGDITLGFNRLAFQGVSDEGMQPMSHGCRWTIVFNGEIYNSEFLEGLLKKRLGSFQNRSGSDTETLLAFLSVLFETGSYSDIELIDGIYSFALHDSVANCIYFANDLFGVKPLFYYCRSERFWICTDISYFFSCEVDSRDVYKSYISKPHSVSPVDLYDGVSETKPGAIYRLDVHACAISLVYEQRLKFSSRTLGWGQAFLAGRRIKSAVASNLVGEYPVCYLLSGGVDSSLISLIAANDLELGSKDNIQTFSVEFADDPYSERGYRRKVIESSSRINNREVVITPDAYFDALHQYIATSRRLPVVPNEVALFLLFKEIKRYGFRVAISGEGADEVFDGYHYIRDAAICNMIRHVRTVPFLGERFVQYIFNRAPRFFLYIQSPSNLLCSVTSDSCYFDGNGIYDLSVIKGILVRNYLGGLLYRADNSSMMNGVEVRVPFLSRKLVGRYYFKPIALTAMLLPSKFILKLILGLRVGFNFSFSNKRGFSIPWASWYAMCASFRAIWCSVKNDAYIADLSVIPEGIEDTPQFNSYFNNVGFRLLCIWLYRSAYVKRGEERGV